ncbi:MAG: extracellular solute-binding protein [Actinobacteria bacterium]|nr:extracellular solute-binding protein [Actinomycetota bacterium]
MSSVHIGRRMSRRDFLARSGTLAAAMTSVPLLEACFGSGTSNTPSGGGGSGTVTVWDIQTGQAQDLLNTNATRFASAHSKIRVTYNWFQNDPYKQKLQVAMGAGNPPDVWMGWGGGVLKSYVDAGDVQDLSSLMSGSFKERFFPQVVDAVTIDGKIYGVPYTGIQPVVLEYNKSLFSRYGVKPPKTWSDLLSTVRTLKQAGVIPVALAGQSTWTYLMYEEYLVDRIGGPGAFQGVLSGKSNAWSHPAIIEANTRIQELVDAGAFGDNFAGVNYDTGQSTALLTTEKAAMHLMGVWDFNQILSANPGFLDRLGLATFPAIDGGKGDPKNAVGNLANFYSISKASKAKDAATTFVSAASLDSYIVDHYINDLAWVPPVNGIESKLNASKQAGFLNFIYNMSKNAPHFQLSWDQALPPQPAATLLTNLSQLFLKQITPQQFSDNMNKTLGG